MRIAKMWATTLQDVTDMVNESGSLLKKRDRNQSTSASVLDVRVQAIRPYAIRDGRKRRQDRLGG